MNKNISVWRGDNTPPTKYHLWLKNNGRLYVNIDEKWLEIDKDSAPLITEILNLHTTKLNNYLSALDNIDSTLKCKADLVDGKVPLELLGNLSNLDNLDMVLFEVVKELPTTNIKKHIYLMKVSELESGTNNLYDEYIYTGDITAAYDASKWEKLGVQEKVQNVDIDIDGTNLNITRPNGEKKEFNLMQLKGDKGERGEKGDKGNAFTFADFTPEQLAALKGAKGDKGDKGEKGADGAKGADGITPTLKVGTVTTLAAGSNATVTMLKNNNEYTLNFGIPKGNKGDTGASEDSGETTVINPTITIGTVTNGDTASASITGDSPNYTLNLVLPKGAKGDKGLQGERGEKGDMGSIGKISISVDNTTGTPSATASSSKAADGSTDISFSFNGIKGEKGEKGERGLQGLPGNDGAKGDKGDTGERGPQGIQGPAGPKGDNGTDGIPAGFGEIIATVDNSTGTPNVTVTTSGTNEAKNFTFAFTGLKGEKGDAGSGDIVNVESIPDDYINALDESLLNNYK